MADKKQLIYKEDLLETVLNHFGCDLVYYGKDLQFCQEAIDMAPAVDAVEVVHGRWAAKPVRKLNGKGRVVNYCDCYYCSECGTDRPIVSPYKYCPNCGAKMDGDSANG